MRPEKLQKYRFSVFDKRGYLPNKNYLIVFPYSTVHFYRGNYAVNDLIATSKDSVVFWGKEKFLKRNIEKFIKLSEKIIQNY